MKRCRKCGGSGVFYDRNIKIGSHGELRVCDCINKECACGLIPPYQVFDKNGNHSWCSCRSPRIRLEATKKAFRDSQIPKKYMWKFCEDFSTDFADGNQAAIANKIMGTISTVRDKPVEEKWSKGLYFWGPAGGGKTLLACIFLQELMLKYGQKGKFLDISRQFFQKLRSSYDTKNESYGSSGQILDDLIAMPFLVIDDFGTQRNTEWESEMLYNLVDSRYEEEKTTIMTSNFNTKEYLFSDDEPSNDSASETMTNKEINADVVKKRWDEKSFTTPKRFESKHIIVSKQRIHSRILEMCRVVHVDLPDYREKLQNAF